VGCFLRPASSSDVTRGCWPTACRGGAATGSLFNPTSGGAHLYRYVAGKILTVILGLELQLHLHHPSHGTVQLDYQAFAPVRPGLVESPVVGGARRMPRGRRLGELMAGVKAPPGVHHGWQLRRPDPHPSCRAASGGCFLAAGRPRGWTCRSAPPRSSPPARRPG